ncbi:hypothetical protein TRFO_05898 [Tritrichomonas foetus]|uniref:Right handed beta helix domain-containing protein n=1 Tax=Tritrichomonas foetus TaxID=1144522 RepID=A0A1J4K2W5_9EUKA|nr:hypothetical protein TRFO_05898 [Tritrichomonas foetus]|eukprot:OHT05727.1 hypothetical protein TRFO_05898 [Tritrichomonas foetus]
MLFFLVFSSLSAYNVYQGETITDHLNFIENSIINVVDCFFLMINSDVSGGAMRMSGDNIYAIVRDSSFVECISKQQAACIYFSGNRIETFRCCSINCTSRYCATFLSSELSILLRNSRMLCDMTTVYNGYTQIDALQGKNNEVAVTNLNVSKSTASQSVLAVEFINVNKGRLAFFNIEKNTARSDTSCLIYCHQEDYPEQHLIEYGNIVDNKGINGGYIFSFICETTVRNVICNNNLRMIVQAIIYHVTFDSCIFDGAATLTDVVTATNCQFMTETATYDFPYASCNCFADNGFVSLKLSKQNNVSEKTWIIAGVTLFVTATVVVAIIATKNKQKKNEEEEVISTAPLME